MAIVPHTSWQKAALVTWAALVLFVGVRSFLQPHHHSVYPIFSATAERWRHGGDLYAPEHGFRYSPTCAVLFTPFALLPDGIGGVLWRLVSVAAFLAALAWFARSVLASRDWAQLALLVIPMSIQSVNNGQANLVVIASMLAAVASVREERWNLAGVLIALAFVCKLYPLALGLVLIVLYPRKLGWRIPAACAASLAAPFLVQAPSYVLDQYAKWIALLQADHRADLLNHMYRDAWLLLQLYGVPLSRSSYLLVQAAGGLGIAALCWHRQRAGWATAPLLTSTLALAAAWMMLLGPATEASSFALLAPSFAWSVVEAVQTNARSARHGWLWASCVLFAVAIGAGGISRDLTIHTCGIHAWASLCYLTYLSSEPNRGMAQPIPQSAHGSLAT